jgi:hypothetical protein
LIQLLIITILILGFCIWIYVVLSKKAQPFKSFFPWLVFFGGLSIEILIDYIWRMQDSNIRTGGIPEHVWFYIQICFAVVSAIYAYIITNKAFNPLVRIGIVSLQLAVGFLLYLFIVLFYVLGTGIDSM